MGSLHHESGGNDEAACGSGDSGSKEEDSQSTVSTMSENAMFITGLFGMVKEMNEGGCDRHQHCADTTTTTTTTTQHNDASHTALVHNVSASLLQKHSVGKCCQSNNKFNCHTPLLSENIVVVGADPKVREECCEVRRHISNELRMDTLLSENIFEKQVAHESQLLCGVNNAFNVSAHSNVLSENIIVPIERIVPENVVRVDTHESMESFVTGTSLEETSAKVVTNVIRECDVIAMDDRMGDNGQCPTTTHPNVASNRLAGNDNEIDDAKFNSELNKPIISEDCSANLSLKNVTDGAKANTNAETETDGKANIDAEIEKNVEVEIECLVVNETEKEIEAEVVTEIKMQEDIESDLYRDGSVEYVNISFHRERELLLHTSPDIKSHTGSEIDPSEAAEVGSLVEVGSGDQVNKVSELGVALSTSSPRTDNHLQEQERNGNKPNEKPVVEKNGDSDSSFCNISEETDVCDDTDKEVSMFVELTSSQISADQICAEVTTDNVQPVMVEERIDVTVENDIDAENCVQITSSTDASVERISLPIDETVVDSELLERNSDSDSSYCNISGETSSVASESTREVGTSEGTTSKVRFNDKVDVTPIPVPFDIIVTRLEYSTEGKLMVTRKREVESAYECVLEGVVRTLALGASGGRSCVYNSRAQTFSEEEEVEQCPVPEEELEKIKNESTYTDVEKCGRNTQMEGCVQNGNLVETRRGGEKSTDPIEVEKNEVNLKKEEEDESTVVEKIVVDECAVPGPGSVKFREPVERKDKSLRDSRSNIPPPLVLYDDGDYAIIPDDKNDEEIEEQGEGEQLYSQVGQGSDMLQLPNKGILEMDRSMRGMVDVDGVALNHVPGPVDGNPYARIDHMLKDKCRPPPRPHGTGASTVDASYDLTRGIEDLEDLLVDLGQVGTKSSQGSCSKSNTYNSSYQCDSNNNDSNSINQNLNSGRPSQSGTNNLHGVPDSKMSSAMNGQLNDDSYGKFPTSCSSAHTNGYTNSPTRNGVTTELKDDVFTESPTVNDLLFVLDKPSERCRNFSKKSNTSSYDNMDDSFYSTSSDIDTSDLRDQNSNTSLEAAMEIHPGTVAKHVKSLQLQISTTNSKTNAPKHGVPLAGIISPASFHEQTSPSCYRNGGPTFKQSDSMHKKVEIDVGHQGHYYTRYDGLRPTDPCDYSEIQSEEDHDVFSKRSTLLSRSDSAYGESMRSSSSSPPLTTPSTPRIDNNYMHEEERKDTCSGESYSPKSDGLNEISSGIASRSSSMTSLDSSGGDNKHQFKQQQHSSTVNSSSKLHGSSRSSVDTIDGTTQTSPTPGKSPSYTNENDVSALNEEHSLNTRALGEMKMPMSIRTDSSTTCSTPRGILKTMDISDRKHLNGGEVFMKGNMATQYQSMESHNSPRSTTERSVTSLGSSPDDFGVHLVDQPQYNSRKLSVGSSTGSEGAHSPRSTGSGNGSIGKQTMGRRTMRSRGGSASSNSSVSSNELFHEIVRNPSVKFDKETMSLWYRPKISREEATALLRDKGPGAFVVRDSQSFEGGFGLAVKVETPPSNVLQQVNGDITKIDYNSELVRHYLIEPCKKGVRLKGSSNETAFPSLMALIYQHSLTKMSLPVELVIPVPLDLDEDLQRETLTEAEILEKGACCNLVYLGGVDVESLTGDGAIHYAMNKVTSQNIQAKTTTINIKVNHKGITLTDNQRRIFFRRHYIMKDVLHCGIDPKGRKINLKALVDNCDREVECFGFVVKKETKSLITLPGNECHICAEIDPNQPASAVINFIHKAMRYSKV